MVATIPHDVLLSFLVGGVARLTARDAAPSDSAARTPAFARAAAFQFLVFVPVGVHLAYLFPDWSWMYFVDPAAISPWWTALGVAGYGAAMLAGWFGTHAALREGAPGRAYAALGVAGAGAAALTLLTLGRLARVGDYAAFRAGTASFAWEHPRFLASAILWVPYWALGFAVLLRSNRRAPSA